MAIVACRYLHGVGISYRLGFAINFQTILVDAGRRLLICIAIIYLIAFFFTEKKGNGFIAVVIAVATVSFQAIKAALMNPVKSLSS